MPVFNFWERFWADFDFQGSPEDGQNDNISFLGHPGAGRGKVELDARSRDAFRTRFMHDFASFVDRFRDPMLLLFPLLRVMPATPSDPDVVVIGNWTR